MKIRKITPVLYAHELEPCIKFWSERFGLEKTVEVPDGERIGFVILQKDNVELMYQSFASARKDAPTISGEIEGGRTFLYLEVEELEPFIAATQSANVVLPLHSRTRRHSRLLPRSRSVQSAAASERPSGDGRTRSVGEEHTATPPTVLQFLCHGKISGAAVRARNVALRAWNAFIPTHGSAYGLQE